MHRIFTKIQETIICEFSNLKQGIKNTLSLKKMKKFKKRLRYKIGILENNIPIEKNIFDFYHSSVEIMKNKI